MFECHLDERGLERMRSRVLALIDLEKDSLRLYRLCAGCKGNREVHGQGVLTEEPEGWIL